MDTNLSCCEGKKARPTMLEKGFRRPTVPPLSHRTLQHPSFMPLYMGAGIQQHRTCCDERSHECACSRSLTSPRPRHDCCSAPASRPPPAHPVHPISPDEVFYCDPNVSSGRIPNIVSDLNVLEGFRLNTPPPIMSARPAPPNHPDLFTCGTHGARDPSNLPFTPTSIPPLPQLCRFTPELTEDGEPAITKLMNPHLQEAQMDLNLDPIQAREVQRWSPVELEAANILLNHFSQMGIDHSQSAVALPDPLLYQSQGSGLVDGGWAGDKENLSCVCRAFSKLSDIERDAVNILLDLKHMEAL